MDQLPRVNTHSQTQHMASLGTRLGYWKQGILCCNILKWTSCGPRGSPTKERVSSIYSVSRIGGHVLMASSDFSPPHKGSIIIVTK